MDNNFVKIGKIIDTRALKGEVKVYPYTNAVDSFDNIEDVYLLIGEKKVQLTIEKSSPYKNIMLLKFKGIDHINDVLQYKGEFIYLKKSDMDRLLNEGEYFVEDLKGLTVLDEKNENQGVIIDVRTGSIQDVLVIEKDNKEWFLPYVDEFVLDIDIDNSIIRVKLIEGLIE